MHRSVQQGQLSKLFMPKATHFSQEHVRTPGDGEGVLSIIMDRGAPLQLLVGGFNSDNFSKCGGSSIGYAKHVDRDPLESSKRCMYMYMHTVIRRLYLLI